MAPSLSRSLSCSNGLSDHDNDNDNEYDNDNGKSPRACLGSVWNPLSDRYGGEYIPPKGGCHEEKPPLRHPGTIIHAIGLYRGLSPKKSHNYFIINDIVL